MNDKANNILSDKYNHLYNKYLKTLENILDIYLKTDDYIYIFKNFINIVNDNEYFINNVSEYNDTIFKLFKNCKLPHHLKHQIIFLKYIIRYNKSVLALHILKLNTLKHRLYNNDYNKIYPFIDYFGNEIIIAKIQNNKHYSCELVKPYIDKNITPDQRNDLYNHLSVKIIEDINSKLYNQCGVFTNKNIKKNECIGVHGGIIFESKLIKNFITYGYNQDYIIYINEDYLLDGINIISKINSIFHKDNNGIWKECSYGYNAKSIPFSCITFDGKVLQIYAIFTIKNIKKNEQILISYNYNPNSVNLAINTSNYVKNTNIKSVIIDIIDFYKQVLKYN
ncbi:type III effector protein [Choristoneura rosaceana entomopoxvirus 'L']|uniref:Type III effector protein n=1 Tax=Choristoneura rosaceana entomopoxvirus 'L' TaxID=1293539 RepID=A0ABM9QKQ4_9POXV|nr:type III effector protein [Choristoneura rosaceana entomopoxvirus 'L']CCU56123.1 type III effector protein [Choristoneura rosaceana entomopoxvirus 'L']